MIKVTIDIKKGTAEVRLQGYFDDLVKEFQMMGPIVGKALAKQTLEAFFGKDEIKEEKTCEVTLPKC